MKRDFPHGSEQELPWTTYQNLMVYVAAGINNGLFVPTGEYKTTRVDESLGCALPGIARATFVSRQVQMNYCSM